jgi:hypothetical protein
MLPRIWLTLALISLPLCASASAEAQPPKPAVALVGFEEAKEVSVTSEVSSFQITLFLAETQGQAQTVRVEATDLWSAGEAAQAVKLTVEPAKFQLPALGVQAVVLSGTVPQTGTFTGMLTFWRALPTGAQPEVPLRKSLKVERGAAQDAFKLEANTPLRMRVLPAWILRGPRRILGFEPYIALPFRIKESRGRPAEFHTPQLDGVQKLGSKGEKGFYFPVRGAASGDCAPEATAGTESGKHNLGAHQICDLEMRLTGLDSPGTYEAKIAATSPGGAAADVKATLVLGHPWYLAWLVLLAGVAGSWFLRNWNQVERPALLTERCIARLRDELGEKLLKDDLVGKKLHRQLDYLLQDLRIDPQAAYDARLKALDTQLDQYLIVRRVLDLNLEKVVWGNAQREEARKLRDALESLVTAPEALNNLEKAAADAKTLEARIPEWNREFLEQQQEALVNEAAEVQAPGDPLETAFKRRSVMEIDRRILRKDDWTLWLAIVVATVVGLKGLWLVDPAFGSFGDYIEAFLWGFGLNEATKAAQLAGRRGFEALVPGGGAVAVPPTP